MESGETFHATVDKRGRIYLPKKFRMKHRLMDGTKYVFKRKEDHILMTPIRPKM